jgi:ADP-L-glycero-D-manno-heptose 6-epimerase
MVGFRYFNVYGPREQHKGTMSSTAFHFHNQINATGVAKLFSGIDGYDNGEQRRDFVYIDDVVDVNLWFLDHPNTSGLFNLGTGHSQSFNDIANAVIKWHGKGEIDYISFPEHLKGAYQSFTEADINNLREVGYEGEFKNVEEGVRCYLNCLGKV